MDSAEKSEKHTARVPVITVLASIIGLWATYFLIVTVRAELLGFPSLDLMLVLRLLSTLGGILVTIGLWLVLRPFDHRRLWVKITAALVLALPAALLTAQIHTVIFADMQQEIDAAPTYPSTSMTVNVDIWDF